MSKAAIVTGASSGIGRAVAKKLASEGLRVIVMGRNSARLKEARDEIVAAGGVATAVQGDVGEEADSQRVVDVCLEEFGRLDVLVNNAGVGHYNSFSEMTPEMYMRVTNTNWCGVLHMTSKALKPMLEQGEGTIVNVSSAGAIAGVPYRTIYCATKAAVTNWSRALFLELRPKGVHVLRVLPTSTETKFFKNIIGNPPVIHALPGRTMSAERAASLIWKAIVAKKQQVILSPVVRLVEIANRISPALTDIAIGWQDRRTAGRAPEGRLDRS